MKLKEICEINPKTREIDDDTEVSFVPMPSVTEDGKIDTSDIRSYHDVKKGHTVFQEGDVLFAKITPCMENGKGAIAYGLMNGKGCGSSEFHVLRPNKDVVTAEWIYYLTTWEWFRNEAEKHMTGSAGQKRVPKAYLENYVVNVPSLEEQKKQTKVLVLLQQIIDDRKKELICLDELIKARFVEMFGSIREDKFPKCTLREVAHIKHGYAFSGESFSEEENEVVLVTPGNFALGGGFQEVRNKYFVSDYPEEYILHAGDLIVTMTDLSKKADTLGYGAIVPDTGKVYLHNQRIGLFDQLDERLNPVFVRWYMQTEEYRLEIVRTSTGSTVHHTSPDRILDSLIYLPPIELQNSFVRFANQVDKSKVAMQKALVEAQLLFDSLMQEYFG